MCFKSHTSAVYTQVTLASIMNQFVANYYDGGGSRSTLHWMNGSLGMWNNVYWKHCRHVKSIGRFQYPIRSHWITYLNSVRWRHNGRYGVSNHQPHDCLLNRLFRRRSKKTSKLRVTGLCAGIHRGPVNSPHKWPVTRKMFPFDDVIMSQNGAIGYENDRIALKFDRWSHGSIVVVA